MARLAVCVSVVCLLLTTTWAAEPKNEADENWPQWRGPLGTGVSPHGDPPVQWSESKNVVWKVRIPGKGSSTPIVWGNQIFVTTAIPTGNRAETVQANRPRRRRRFGPPGIDPSEVLKFVLYAIDRLSGNILWQKTVREELPHEGTHPTGTWASNSPVTDGRHIYAYFGSRGLYCFDMEGKRIWDVDFGDMRKRLGFGEGASPALYGDSIIVNWDHEGQSFIVALDKGTGKEIWRTNRDEMTSWSTPIVVEQGGKAQIITSATNKVRGYDLETGRLIWETPGMTLNAIPSPVFSQGMVFVTSGFRGNALMAIRLDKAKGNIEGTDAVVWKYDRDTPYAPSPLLYDSTLYFVKRNNGILSSFNALNGESIFGPNRLNSVPNIYASPVGAAGRIYIAGREGTTVVLEHGTRFKILATNDLDDGFDASPAVVGNEIILRGHKHLYRISEE